jgi:alpha-D-xyloside xylohydrolase
MKFTDGYWVTLRAYGLRPGDETTVRVGDVTFTVVREGDTLRAARCDPAAPWTLGAAGHEVQAPAGTGLLTLGLEPA